MTGDVVRNGLDLDSGQLATRHGNDRFRLLTERDLLQRLPKKLDHELTHTLGSRLTGLPTIAESGCHATRQRARIGLVGQPVKFVREVVTLPRLGRLGRHPHRNDVVVNLVVGRNLGELDRARSPVTPGLDPGGGPEMVTNPIMIVIQDAITLQQSKAARRAVLETGHRNMRWIVEGTPDVLPNAIPDGQPVRVVDLRTPVDRRWLGRLGKPVHGRQRRDAETVDILAQIERRLDLHHDAFGPMQREPVSTRQAGTIQQGVDDQRITRLGSAFEPKGGEVRKFLRVGCPGSNRNSAGR